MRHLWRDLTFLHYSVEPEVVQKLLPEELTVDTYDGRAWVGLVPFWMTGIRVLKMPKIPGMHTFPETNVRTYVHREGKNPGIWFFSLDAESSLAVWGARATFGLPYHRAEMNIDRQDDEIRYRSVRRGSTEAAHDLRIKRQEEWPYAEPGSLEFFLIERYLLYSKFHGKIVTGQVHHEPYSLFSADLESGQESMMTANALPTMPWEHMCYSPGVEVDVYAVKKDQAALSKP